MMSEQELRERGLRVYECEYYRVTAPARSCLFCAHCTDVFWDYTNGPYAVICDLELEYMGECGKFEEDDE